MSSFIIASVIASLLFGVGLTAYVVWRLAPRSDAMAVGSANVILVPVSVIDALEQEIECLRNRLTAIEVALAAGSDSEIIRVIKNVI